MELLYEYAILSTIPVWFTSYAVIRMKRHWNDGKDRFIVLNRHVYLKWFITLMMTLLTSVHVIDYILFSNITQISIIVRGVFFSFVLVSWIISFALAIFENNKRLLMKWSGHRSFWPANLVMHVILFVGEFVYLKSQNLIVSWSEGILIAYAIQIIFCFILSMYAVLRPNEFVTIGEYDYSLVRRLTRKLTANTMLTDQVELPKISIKSYKIKENFNETYFTIISTIKFESFVAKRTVADFENLQKFILGKFNADLYPNMSIPNFPNIFPYSTEDRMKIFAEYLNALASPEFMLNEVLDFLEVVDPWKENLMKKDEEGVLGDTIINEQRSGSIIEKYFQPKSAEKEVDDEQNEYRYSRYFTLKISKWLVVESHIEYFILWSSPKLELTGSAQKRYNEILELHKILSKIVSPARLPKFPSKNYLKILTKIDEKALNRRKSQLESYFSHIINDPAFLCQEVLDFLNIPSSIEKILIYKFPICEISLQPPLHCDLEIDDSGHFIVYNIKLCKSQDIKKVEWNVIRRFREFDELNVFLIKRGQSPLLPKRNSKGFDPIPSLPSRSVAPLISPSEIENRRIGIEKYLEDLLLITDLQQAYCLHEFLQEPEFQLNFVIN